MEHLTGNIKLIIGFITYRQVTAKYLPYFLISLKEQTFKNFQILVVDNTETKDNENARFIKENYPSIELEWAGRNLGFAKAYNKMISQAIKLGAEYFLCINPDMILEPGAVSELVKVFTADKKIGAAQPKILKWNLNPVKSQESSLGSCSEFNKMNNSKINIIDSIGLVMDKSFRFYDYKQGENNSGEKENKEIFGFTGAAVMFKIDALKDAAYLNHQISLSSREGRGEFFDELMFMYKEDCDLSLRMRLAGWKIILAPQAIVYHDRTAAITGKGIKDIFKSRLTKSRQVKKWSFLNQWIIILKYINLFSWRVKLATWWYQIKSLLFVLLFEQYLLLEFWELWKIRKTIKKKSKELKVRINIKEIEKFLK